MFDIMIPAFQTIFAEIRDLLIPQNEVDLYQGADVQMPDGTFIETFNWPSFYKYFSMQGLESNNAYQQTITQNPTEQGKYQYYSQEGSGLNKNCQ